MILPCFIFEVEKPSEEFEALFDMTRFIRPLSIFISFIFSKFRSGGFGITLKVGVLQDEVECTPKGLLGKVGILKRFNSSFFTRVEIFEDIEFKLIARKLFLEIVSLGKIGDKISGNLGWDGMETFRGFRFVSRFARIGFGFGDFLVDFQV